MTSAESSSSPLLPTALLLKMNDATENDHEFLVMFDKAQLQTWHHARFGNKGGNRNKDELARAITNGISWTTFLHDYVKDVTDKNGRSAITIAAANGHDDIVRALITAGANVNGSGKHIPLVSAAKAGHEDCVRAMIDAGANVDTATEDGETGLTIAVQGGHAAVVLRLIEVGANVNHVTEDGKTPLYFAAYYEYEGIVRALIRAGANVNAATKSGLTPLYFAAYHEHEDIVRALIRAGANVNAAAEDGDSPVAIAACCGHADIVHALIEAGANVNATDNKGETPVLRAAKHGHEKCVRLLLSAGATLTVVTKRKFTMLMAVSIGGLASVIPQALPHSDINAVGGDDGRTALIYASECGNEECVRQLLGAHANVNMVNAAGQTALHCAAERGHESIVRQLLDANANVNMVNAAGQTALHRAVGSEATVRALCEAKANVDIPDHMGGTALMKACDAMTPLGKVAHMGRTYGREGCVRVLVKAGASLDAADSTGKTVLMTAGKEGDETLASLLLQAGARTDLRNQDGRTALDLARDEGHVSVYKMLQACEGLRSGEPIDAACLHDLAGIAWRQEAMRLAPKVKFTLRILKRVLVMVGVDHTIQRNTGISGATQLLQRIVGLKILPEALGAADEREQKLPQEIDRNQPRLCDHTDEEIVQWREQIISDMPASDVLVRKMLEAHADADTLRSNNSDDDSDKDSGDVSDEDSDDSSGADSLQQQTSTFPIRTSQVQLQPAQTPVSEDPDAVSAHDTNGSASLPSTNALIPVAPSNHEASQLRAKVHVSSNAEDVLGQGSFATVYKGKFEGQDVAVKVFSSTGTAGTAMADFRKEAATLEKLRHEHVINFVCALPSTSAAETSMLVMQYAPGGSLKDLLYPPKGAPSPLRTQPEKRLTIATHVAAGLTHIHNKGLIHRDVKPANVLLMGDGTTAKVSDVGLARILSSETGDASATLRGCGTPLYKAPEQHRGEPLSRKTDVFAFGILLNELESGQRPWQIELDDLAVNQPSVDVVMQLKLWVPQGRRPSLEAGTRFCPLITRCWDNEPSNRPTIEDVVTEIESSSRSLSPEPSLNDDIAPTSGEGSDSLGLAPLQGGHGHVSPAALSSPGFSEGLAEITEIAKTQEALLIHLKLLQSQASATPNDEPDEPDEPEPTPNDESDQHTSPEPEPTPNDESDQHASPEPEPTPNDEPDQHASPEPEPTPNDEPDLHGILHDTERSCGAAFVRMHAHRLTQEGRSHIRGRRIQRHTIDRQHMESGAQVAPERVERGEDSTWQLQPALVRQVNVAQVPERSISKPATPDSGKENSPRNETSSDIKVPKSAVGKFVPKRALCVGVGDYSYNFTYEQPPGLILPKAVKDAANMANALRRKGYDVTQVIDCDICELRDAVQSFLMAIKEPGVTHRLVYFAGHGVEARVKAGDNAANWLLAKEIPPSPDLLPDCAIDAQRLLAGMEQCKEEGSFNVLILDCCRDDFPQFPTYRSLGGGVGRGLREMQGEGSSLIAFACAAQMRAIDGLYMESLLKHIEKDLNVFDMFSLVIDDVTSRSTALTGQTQTPWLYSSIRGLQGPAL